MFSCHSVPGGAEPMTLSQLMTNPHHHCRSCCMWGSFLLLSLLQYFTTFTVPWDAVIFWQHITPCKKALLPEAPWSCCTTERKWRRLWNPSGDKRGQGVSLTEWLCGIVSSLSAGVWRCPPCWVSQHRGAGERAGRWSLAWGKDFHLGDWPARVLCKCFSLHTNHLEENTSC